VGCFTCLAAYFIHQADVLWGAPEIGQGTGSLVLHLPLQSPPRAIADLPKRRDGGTGNNVSLGTKTQVAMDCLAELAACRLDPHFHFNDLHGVKPQL
jgi:hypothetical protein